MVKICEADFAIMMLVTTLTGSFTHMALVVVLESGAVHGWLYLFEVLTDESS